MKIIINIGRQVGSNGGVLAKRLAEEFGCTFYDKEILNLAAQESGFKEQFFEQHDETKSFFHAIAHCEHPFIGSNWQSNVFSPENIYQMQSDAIRKAAEQGSCVFVGRTADYILRNEPNVVNIFIAADTTQRIATICKRMNFSEQQAKHWIKEQDRKRASYYNYYTGKTWGHAESYDLCLNTTTLGEEKSFAFIKEFICLRFSIK